MATTINISIASSIVDNAHKAYDSGAANVLTNDDHGRHFWIQTTNAAWILHMKFGTPIFNPKHGPLLGSVAEAYHDLRDQVGPDQWAAPGVAVDSTFWVPDADCSYGYHEITDESQLDGVTPTKDCDDEEEA